MGIVGLRAATFNGGLDYAGLFPPAKLKLADAVDEYRRIKEGPHGAVARAFTIQASQLAELGVILSCGGGEMEVAVVGERAATSDAWEGCRESDAKSMNGLVQNFPDQVRFSSYEVKLPTGMNVETAAKDLLGFEEGQAYMEVDLNLPVETLAEIADLAAEHGLGIKARMGGVTAGSVPSDDSIVGLIVTCSQFEVPLKGTAGLHHAYRTLNQETGDREFGFLNILAALAFAYDMDLSASAICEILGAESGLLDEVGQLAWQGEVIEDSGAELFESGLLAIGTCSIDEILENVAALKVPSKG